MTSPKFQSISASLISAAALLASTGLASADSAQPRQVAQAAAASGMAASKPIHTPDQDVEKHIKMLHDQLKITPDEETKWNDVAQAMRDNAAAVSDAERDREAKLESGASAIDNLKSYQAVLRAQSESLDKLVGVVEPLYASMPDDQKQVADTVFNTRIAKAAKHHHAS